MASAAVWTPNAAALQDIITTLQASATPSTSAQQESYRRIEQFKQNAEFSQYLVHILAHMASNQVGMETRQVAGLLLKRNIDEMYHLFPKELKTSIQSQVLPVLADADISVRNAVGSLVSTMVMHIDIEELNLDVEWSNLIPTLVNLIESGEPNAVAGALSALTKISEDSCDLLLSSQSRPLNTLIPHWIRFFQSPVEAFRRDSLRCITNVMSELPQALIINMDAFLGGISALTSDSSTSVRRLVCQSIVLLTEVGIQYIVPHLESIIQFIISCNRDDDEAVALEACEFWSAFCDQPFFNDLRHLFDPFLPSVIPLLLNQMVYSESDICTFEAEAEEQNESVPDRPENIKPIFHKSKEDDDDDDDNFGEWNLRKCSAAALDTFSHNYGSDMLPTLLPLLQERLVHQGHWSVRESGILALGAISDGCMEGIYPHLPQLFPYLLQLMNDEAPLIRTITCWTLSRYAPWAVAQQEHQQILQPLVESLLKRILDSNKKVQEAACSAFCAVEEEAQDNLIPYLVPILQTLMFAFEKYQARNLLILYDAIGTLAESVGSALNNRELISLLMPRILQKWHALPDDNRELFPLLESLGSIAQALGVGFQDYVPDIVARCVRLVEKGLFESALYEQNPNEQLDAPDPEFVVVSLDLISNIVEGGKSNITPLVANTSFMNLVLECMTSSTSDIRQSALALVGDLAQHSVELLRPGLPQIFNALVRNIVPAFPSACNNACWAIGEIAVKIGGEIEPFALSCLKNLVPMINNKDLPKSLVENCAIAIGRLGYATPAVVGPVFPEFIQRWCLSIPKVRDALDREQCFLGLCYLIKANPDGATTDFIYVCGAIASYDHNEASSSSSSELPSMFNQILHGYKANFADRWPKYFSGFPPQLQQSLVAQYNL